MDSTETLNPFAIAQRQFDEAAELLGLDPSARAFLREPMREFVVTIPVRMDEGNTRVFKGYRVQYNNSRGPTKGGLRFHPEETIDTGTHGPTDPPGEGVDHISKATASASCRGGKSQVNQNES